MFSHHTAAANPRVGNRGHRAIGRVTAIGCSLLLLLSSARGNGHSKPPPEEIDFHRRPEAWAMKNFSGVMLFSGFNPPETLEPESVDLALEIGHIPRLSRDERRVGFDGRKLEDANKAPLLIRPRLTIGLPSRFSVTASYVPPIRVFDAKTELTAFSVNRPLIETDTVTAGLRAFAQYGKVRGSITCPHADWEDPDFPAIHCDEASNDTMRSRVYGLELGASYRISRLHDLAPYVTLSYQTMDLDFEVDAIINGGHRDNRNMVASGETWAAGTGVSLPLNDRLQMSAGVVYMPNRVKRQNRDRRNEPMINTRLQISYALQ